MVTRDTACITKFMFYAVPFLSQGDFQKKQRDGMILAVCQKLVQKETLQDHCWRLLLIK